MLPQGHKILIKNLNILTYFKFTLVL